MNREQAAPSTPSLRRRLIGGGAWAVVGKGAALALNFVTIAMVTRLLDVGSVGVYQLGQSVVLAVSLIGRLGLDTTVVYLVSSSVARGETERARRAIRTVLVLGACGALATSAALVFGGVDLLGAAFGKGSYGRLAVLAPAMGVWSASIAVQILASESFRGFHDIREAVVYGGFVSGLLTSACFAVYTVASGHVAVTTAAWTTSSCIGVSAVAAVIALYRRVRQLPKNTDSKAVHDDGYGGVLRRSLPVLVSNVMTYLLTNVDVWVVGAFLNAREVAIYATPAKLVTLIGVSFMIANQVLPPLIGELAAKNDKALMERTLRGTAFVVGVPSMMVVAMFVFAGAPILRLAFGPAYEAGWPVLALLCVGQAANILTGSSLFALLMTGHGVAAMWISGIMGLVATAACVFAVRHWGAVGVAAAVSAVIVVQQVVTLLAARRLVGVWTHVSVSAASVELRRMLAKRRRA